MYNRILGGSEGSGIHKCMTSKGLIEEFIPPVKGSVRWTFVNATSTNEERKARYWTLRAAGYSAKEARIMRDYRDQIVDKRIEILAMAYKLSHGDNGR